MSPRPLRRVLAAGSGLLVAGTLAACTPHPSPEVAVRSFLLAWQDGDHAEAARYTTGDPAEVEEALVNVREQLDLASLRFGLGLIEREGESATAAFDVTADLGIGDPTWSYTGEMPLEWGPDGWRITWSSAVIHPELSDDERLAVSYEQPERGQILDREGRELVSADSVTAFGVVPAEMDDKEAGVTELAELLDEEPEPLLNRVRSAPPEQFQPLVLMRDSSVDESLLGEAGRIQGVATEEVRINMSPTVAPALLGEVAGTAEHRVSARVAGPYQAGDTVGLSGLQSIFQRELAGSGTAQVVSLDESGAVTDVLEDWEGERSGGVDTTLDADVQRAAEAALAPLPGRAYLAAVDTASGEVLAAANGSGSASDDSALNGSFVPGGAFTIVGALAALESGAVGPDDQVPCGYETTIDDQTFTNPGQGALSSEFGGPDLARNLAHSCTVGFAGLAPEVGADSVERAALELGIGADWQLPVPASPGSVSVGEGDAGVASAMVGEDGVRVSPLSMALAAATVANGEWNAPTLVPAEGPSPSPETELDEADLEVVRQGMRDAVTTRMPELLGQETEVFGQAARVALGDGTDLHWFVGYQGDVAFALVAEANSATTLVTHHAVNGAQTFLTSLATGVVPGEPTAPAGDATIPDGTSPDEADLTGGGEGGTDAAGW
ncbi:penicillin-binding transpeptidase domain-containing protein [Nocardiopsis sp. NRRL B-16309]|uniref:penicillin-binding transpeptidase domain-containing protein n=1 Tax=Nocardiopsis sp. NRRL B-16309 TaxID=1519494 RepID=UPI0006AF51D9|nr:penicillin-binding transpeptidase domain-containing protein [Nocardiopsis sp. NRRL B-16309]